ncbi:MAG: Na(+)/H(+) antiporter NhaA [Hyphomicrobiales bacterium]|nr:Na(+)/H(+) antiporter NhaA [Hyphomicrobiales bacterium]
MVGKLIGVFGSAYVAIRVGFAKAPAGASLTQLLGVSLLCGTGFTMSLFTGMLAFANDPAPRSRSAFWWAQSSLACLVGQCSADCLSRS